MNWDLQMIYEDVSMDAQYMDAVRRGDKNEIKHIIDMFAKNKGYFIGPVYHGTNQKGLTEFYGGWWSDNKDVTREFGNYRYTAYLRGNIADSDTLRELYIEFNGDDIDPDSDDSYEMEENRIGDEAMSGNPFSRFFREKGFDGIEVWDESNAVNGMAYSVFESNQIKLADPVTYDDNGRIIPLSQRFDSNNDDIRY